MPTFIPHVIEKLPQTVCAGKQRGLLTCTKPLHRYFVPFSTYLWENRYVHYPMASYPRPGLLKLICVGKLRDIAGHSPAPRESRKRGKNFLFSGWKHAEKQLSAVKASTESFQPGFIAPRQSARAAKRASDEISCWERLHQRQPWQSFTYSACAANHGSLM